MSDYAKTVKAHRRLAILRHLAECQDYTSNVAILQAVLNGVGVSSSRDQIVTELAWLKENGFALYEDNGGFVVAEATGRGVEIAKGIATHPDIQRPSPRH